MQIDSSLGTTLPLTELGLLIEVTWESETLSADIPSLVVDRCQWPFGAPLTSLAQHLERADQRKKRREGFESMGVSPLDFEGGLLQGKTNGYVTGTAGLRTAKTKISK